MGYKKIRKGMVIFCTALLLGTVACKSAPITEQKPEATGTEQAERTAVVKLSDAGIEIAGAGCEADGTRLKIKEAGVYEISGSLSNGSIYVNADNESEVHLILDGVTVHNETGAAVYCKKASKVTITLAKDSVNMLSDGSSYVFEEGEDEPDATLYAKHDLVIDGGGRLTVTSAYGDAVKGKDSLYILGGELNVTSAEDGIVGRDLLQVTAGTVTVDAAADALKASNDVDAGLGNIVIDGGSFTLTAGEDGMQAENTLTINGGTFDITSGGGAANAPVKTDSFGFGGGMDWGKWGDWSSEESTEEDTVSTKGLKAGELLQITGGRFELDTCDDALHSNTNIVIKNGEFNISAGDDGAHADETLEIVGGKIQITKSYEGLEGLYIMVSGGEIDITSDDDGMNAAGGADGSGFGRPGMGMFGEGEGEVTISGGVITVDAGGDGLDSNGDLTINGGVITAYGSTGGGEGALDYGGTFCLNGGTVFAAGGSVMGLAPADTSGQYSLAVGLDSQEQAGSKVEIIVNGEMVFSEEVPRQFNYVIASSEKFVKDAEVSVKVNGENCYEGILSEVVTRFGFSGGMGGFGGPGGFGGGGKGDKGDFGGGMWPSFPDGDMPQMPEGEWPSSPNGDMPQMPEGEWPDFPNGDMPQRPKGERSEAPGNITQTQMSD
ncbi:MAG: carbohydrate-binding domain-containing protein [Lachnospiraceae bacterium]|nr:carbohydrate-binding domain-containing protein [Lachnospiraceae bacterium]